MCNQTSHITIVFGRCKDDLVIKKKRVILTETFVFTRPSLFLFIFFQCTTSCVKLQLTLNKYQTYQKTSVVAPANKTQLKSTSHQLQCFIYIYWRTE